MLSSNSITPTSPKRPTPRDTCHGPHGDVSGKSATCQSQGSRRQTEKSRGCFAVSNHRDMSRWC